MAIVDLIEAIARQAVEAMLNGLWLGTALTALVWFLLKAVPRTNATTRYVIWWGTLIAVTCLPVVTNRAPLTTGGNIGPWTYENTVLETTLRGDIEDTERAQRKTLRPRRVRSTSSAAACEAHHRPYLACLNNYNHLRVGEEQ